MDRQTLQTIARELYQLGDHYFALGQITLANLAWELAARTEEHAEGAADSCIIRTAR